jgi:hypothetical protein
LRRDWPEKAAANKAQWRKGQVGEQWRTKREKIERLTVAVQNGIRAGAWEE